MKRTLSIKPRKPVIMRYNGLDSLEPRTYSDVYLAGFIIVLLVAFLTFFVLVVSS